VASLGMKDWGMLGGWLVCSGDPDVFVGGLVIIRR